MSRQAASERLRHGSQALTFVNGAVNHGGSLGKVFFFFFFPDKTVEGRERERRPQQNAKGLFNAGKSERREGSRWGQCGKCPAPCALLPPRVPCWSVADGWKRRESPRSVFLAEEGSEGWLAVEKPAGIERSLGEASDGAGNGVIMSLISPIPSPGMFWGRMCDGAPS